MKKAFITYKRSLGYVYDTQERYLKHYQRYIEEKYPHLDLPDKASTDCFLDKYKGKPGGLYNAMAPLREFAGYLFQLGYRDACLIPPKQMPKPYPEPPYSFSEEEFSAFFRECDSCFVDNPGSRTRGIIMPRYSGCCIAAVCALKRPECCQQKTCILIRNILISCNQRSQKAEGFTSVMNLPFISSAMTAGYPQYSLEENIFPRETWRSLILYRLFAITLESYGRKLFPAGKGTCPGYMISGTILPGLP